MQEDFQFLGAFGVPNVKEIFVAHHTPLPVSGVLLHMGSVIACPRLHDNMCVPAFLAAMQNRCAVATHISRICGGHAQVYCCSGRRQVIKNNNSTPEVDKHNILKKNKESKVFRFFFDQRCARHNNCGSREIVLN